MYTTVVQSSNLLWMWTQKKMGKKKKRKEGGQIDNDVMQGLGGVAAAAALSIEILLGK